MVDPNYVVIAIAEKKFLPPRKTATIVTLRPAQNSTCGPVRWRDGRQF